MSNRVRPRELNGGRLTRPRDQWKGKSRNRMGRNPMAADMNRVTSTLFRAISKASFFPKVTMPARKGDSR